MSWVEEYFAAWARHAQVPVINMESALYHPLQALADGLGRVVAAAVAQRLHPVLVQPVHLGNASGVEIALYYGDGLGAVVLGLRGNCDGERRRHRPIAVLEKLLPHHPADKLRLGRAHQLGDDELPGGGDERQVGELPGGLIGSRRAGRRAGAARASGPRPPWPGRGA
mgnify:CR=1 FL=1